MRYLTVLAFCVLFPLSLAWGTKCFHAKNLNEYKNDFDIVFTGKAIQSYPFRDSKKFQLDITVDKVLKGELASKNVQAFGYHFGVPKKYFQNKLYTFVMSKNKNGKYDVILPEDGCPDIPTF